ncbi:MAG: hypothetical protein H6751_03630 [Candidatus Omnitrophica bacterium]|nr:hypothetical protein [Candidatus Omnitrophota bacterium]
MTPGPRNILLLSVVLLILSAGLYSLGALWLNTNLQAGDQGAYLHLSLAQKHGIALTDGNRHPLYSALLLPIAERDPQFFARARWFSLIIGLLFLGSIAWNEIGVRKDLLSAFLAMAFLSLHLQMGRTLSEIWCEPLLYFLVYLPWWMLDSRGKPEEMESKKFLLLGGVLTGLIYLTKGTGLQVAALFWVTVFIFAKNRLKPFVGIGVFLLVASPLLVWNTVVYHSPVYSFASTHNMWFDEADEIWYDDPEDLPTLGSYLKTHTPTEIAGRLGRGLILESKMAFQLLWSDWKLPEGSSLPASIALFAFKLIILVGLPISILRLFREPSSHQRITSRPALVFFLLMVGFMFPAFGWYAQLTDAPRFIMTLVPIAVVLLGRILSSSVESTLQQSGAGSKVLLSGILIFSLFAMLQTASFAWKTRDFPAPSLDPSSERILEEVNQLPEGAKIAFGPSHGLPLWLSRPDLEWRPTPWRIDLERFKRMLERERIGYVLLDGETLARRPYLAPLAGPSASETLGWRIRSRFRSDTGFFILYELSP